ncbi:hypothetical protein H3C66_04255 [Patescibacteria group bacterium]|nr:hypothetical protein [Patescibacteria group bacterium]
MHEYEKNQQHGAQLKKPEESTVTGAGFDKERATKVATKLMLPTSLLLMGVLTSEVAAQDGEPTPTPNPNVDTWIRQMQAQADADATATAQANNPEPGRTLIAQVPTETEAPPATPTSEPTATPTLQPGETPTPGETLVAALPAESMLSNSMAIFPNRVEYHSILGAPVNLEMRWNRVENPLMGVNGVPIMPGLYEERPMALSNGVLDNPEQIINGAEIDEDFMVGRVTHIESVPGGNPIIYLTVPMQDVNETGNVIENPDQPVYGTFQVSLWNEGNSFRVIENNGNVAALPTGAQNERLGMGENPDSRIVYDRNNQTVSIPSANGPVVIRIGTMMGVEYVGNVEDISNGIVSENGNRTTDQVIEDARNGISGPRAIIYQLDMLVPRQ